jgi:hypothetical protein
MNRGIQYRRLQEIKKLLESYKILRELQDLKTSARYNNALLFKGTSQ